VTWIDIVLGIVVALSVLSGIRAGFARVGVGFVATLAGIFVGFWFYGIPAAYVRDYVSSKALANLIGFFLIFAAILLLGSLIGRLLAKLFKWIGLSWFDRLLGAAFGFVRGIVIAVAIVTVVLACAPIPPPPSITDSRSMPYVIEASNILAAATPHEIKDAFRETKDKVKQIWSDHLKPKKELHRENV
jgi:membrane protein required for colicin V production